MQYNILQSISTTTLWLGSGSTCKLPSGVSCSATTLTRSKINCTATSLNHTTAQASLQTQSRSLGFIFFHLIFVFLVFMFIVFCVCVCVWQTICLRLKWISCLPRCNLSLFLSFSLSFSLSIYLFISVVVTASPTPKYLFSVVVTRSIVSCSTIVKVNKTIKPMMPPLWKYVSSVPPVALSQQYCTNWVTGDSILSCQEWMGGRIRGGR